MQDGRTPSLIPYLLLVFCLFIPACTSVKPMPDDASALIEIDSCNIVGHLQCIYLTGKETLDDGLERSWTRHWFRMSYIGKACEKKYGRTAAVIFESIFAIPHYTFIGIGNGLATMASPFVDKDKTLKIPE